MATLPDAELRELLKTLKSIAVIGLSPMSSRPSFGVTRYMISEGYEIYGVRPASPPEILGRPCVERLSELKHDVDIINVFRASDAIPAVVDEIEEWIKTRTRKPRLLFIQEGISHPQAEEKARGLGLKVVSDRCILKEHARLL